ncbi:MAG: hypothetical protein NXH85_16400 [Pseudomonadaceae bacterium]|nr:hypothetical protein [Pseudomonadaceae bacterium]
MTGLRPSRESGDEAFDAADELLDEFDELDDGAGGWLSPGWRALIAAVLGGSAYAGWAYFANQQHGTTQGLSAAVTQGAYSFTAALVTTLLLDRFRHAFGPSWRGSLATLFLSCTGLTMLGYVLHWSAGTPEILVTISPGAILGSAYAAAYVIALDSKERSRLADAALGEVGD